MVDLTEDSRSPATPDARKSFSGAGAQPSRRGFLALAGGAVVSIGSAAAVAADVYGAKRGVFASGAGPAYEPWQEWEDGTAPLRLVRSGILAANAHNAQAWQFAISAERISVYADTRRDLGAVDLYQREMQLSAGCAIENVVLAASAAGLRPAVTLAADGDSPLLATIDLTPGPREATGLYRAIPRRHTDRASYQSGRALPDGVPASMAALSGDPSVRLLWLLTSAQRAQFSTATVAATTAFIADPGESRDDFRWYRGTYDQVQSHRDGVTAAAGGLSPVVRSLGTLVPASRASNGSYWLAGTRDRQLPTASGFAIVLVRNASDVAQRLAAGRLYQRLHLWATTQGMSMQPLNQLVERAERERSGDGAGPASSALTALVGDAAWQPVMPFRIGYPTTPAPASPRRDVHDVVVTR
jgi:hypothetical protein